MEKKCCKLLKMVVHRTTYRLKSDGNQCPNTSDFGKHFILSFCPCVSPLHCTLHGSGNRHLCCRNMQHVDVSYVCLCSLNKIPFTPAIHDLICVHTGHAENIDWPLHLQLVILSFLLICK